MATNAVTTASSVPQAQPPLDLTRYIEAVDRIADRLAQGLNERAAAIWEFRAELDGLKNALAADGLTLLSLLAWIGCVLVCTLVIYYLVRRCLSTLAPHAWPIVGEGTSVLASLFLTRLTVFMLTNADGALLSTLYQWNIASLAGVLLMKISQYIILTNMRNPLGRTSSRERVFMRDLYLALSWAVAGLGLQSTLRLWHAGPGLTDAVLTLGIALPCASLFSWAFWHNRRLISLSVAGDRPRSAGRARLAGIWPVVVATVLLTAFVSMQAAMSVGIRLPSAAVLFTCGIFVSLPHGDAVLGAWARSGLDNRRAPLLGVALRQTLRFAIVILATDLLMTLWTAPLAAGLGLQLNNVAGQAFQFAVILLTASLLWNIVAVFSYRNSAPTRVAVDEDATGTPSSRGATLVPLVANAAKVVIVIVATLTVLVSMGVNVWPIITSFSVFGLAIGFGSQALVKDIVSGLFFLVDDAFRFGEYIEIADTVGVVENILIRSLSIRHPRGALTTIPYGQISKVQNHSRDWAIEKLRFRVALETDVEKVRRLFKAIGLEIAANPQLAPDLIEPFKSQGISMVEDGTLVITGKFKARPGQVSMIRRTVYLAVLKAFQEHGIKLVPKPLDAGAPPEREFV